MAIVENDPIDGLHRPLPERAKRLGDDPPPVLDGPDMEVLGDLIHAPMAIGHGVVDLRLTTKAALHGRESNESLLALQNLPMSGGRQFGEIAVQRVLAQKLRQRLLGRQLLDRGDVCLGGGLGERGLPKPADR